MGRVWPRHEQRGRPLNAIVRHQSIAMEETPANMFRRILKIPERFAAAYDAAGYTSIDEIAYVPIEELKSVVEMPDWVFDDIRKRAREHLMYQALGGQPPPWGEIDA